MSNLRARLGLKEGGSLRERLGLKDGGVPMNKGGKLPPGVKRATEQVDKSAVLAAAKPARQAIQGYLGMDPSYSVMDPQAEKLASAYRTGEATSVLGDIAGALSPFAYASAMSKVGQVPGIAELIAYHGSPHKFKKFDASKIGTGEGAQAYGHGLYFAEAPGVASEYRKQLAGWPKEAKNIVNDVASLGISDDAAREVLSLAASVGKKEFDIDTAAKWLGYRSRELRDLPDAQRKEILLRMSQVETPGSLYKVDIPDEKIAQMLDWDKPLSQQPEAIQKIAKEYNLTKNASGTGEAKGSYIYQSLATRLAQPPFNEKNPFSSGAPAASERLRELGIPGIRYLDQGSRGTGKGTSNFVVFPGEEESIKMLEINGTLEMAKGGAVHMQDGGDPTARFMGKTKPQGIMQAKGFGEGPGMRPLQEAADVGRGLFGAEAIIPGGEGYRTGQALANMPAVGLAAVPGKVASALPEVVTGLGALGAAGVIKPKGGNWLAGSFSAEKALGSLKRHQNPEQELAYIRSELEKPQKGDVYNQLMARLPLAERSTALNKWIDTKLTKYVKNEMATPEDPIRALAERGTLHFEPQDVPNPIGWNNESRMLFSNREAANYPTEGLGKSSLARDWETLADLNIQPDKAEVFLPIKSELERNPWLEKVSPDTPVYGMNLSADLSRLGFPHIIDELTNALNPNSGLPASLRLTPQQLEKVTVPQAVERVAKINEWRAAQKAEADAMRARNPATFEHRAYETVPGTTEPNQKGLRWVELKAPSNESMPLEERKALIAKLQAEGLSPETWPREQLEAALKYEGEVMGHCVGGYCPDVIEGRSRIYSLRDKKGEPHVTIEVEPDMRAGFREGEGPRTPEEDVDLRNLYINQVRTNRVPQDVAFAQWWRARNNIPEPEQRMQITQIKGKANKAPKDEYLPFVQDFVRSGNWSRVGDLKNTGLQRLQDLRLHPELVKQARERYGEYLSSSDLEELLRPKPEEGMKAGGKVTFTDNPDVQAMVVRMSGGGDMPRSIMQAKGFGEGREDIEKALQAIKESAPVSAASQLASGYMSGAGGTDLEKIGQAVSMIPMIGLPATIGKAARVGKAGDVISDSLRAKYPDVDISLAGDKQLNLGKIVVPKEMRGQGVGTQVMNDLVKQADEAGSSVTLSPSADFGGNKERLKEFYKRFGFVENKGKNKDFSISESMYREPIQQKPSAFKAPQDKALLEAQRAAALPIEQGGLGLPPDNTPDMRAAAMGYQDFYHGTERLDRLLEKGALDPRRATSGPMPFGTESKQMASTYATSKRDTSRLAQDEGNVADYFTVSAKNLGYRSNQDIPVEKAFYFLPREKQQEIISKVKRIGYANPQEATGDLVLHPEGMGGSIMDPKTIDYYLQREAKGNPLTALRIMWHDSGTLYNNEEQLAKVFELAGFPFPISQKNAPWSSAQGVLTGKARLNNPLTTTDAEVIESRVIPALKQAFAKDRTRKQAYGPDQWAKNVRFTPKEWVAELEKDMAEGKNSYVWTSIPDKVTAELRKLGFDGIVDAGGKGGGAQHRVVIPFDTKQVRSRFAAFNPLKKDEPGLLKAKGGKVRFTDNPDVQAMVVKMAKELPKAVNKGKKYA